MRIAKREEKKVTPRIIFEDDCLLVLDKPSGWVVNDSQSSKNLQTVQSWLEKMSYPLSKNSQKRSGIVHRLDKETSGILIIAKKDDVFTSLQKEFQEREVKKTYLALIHGKLEPRKGQVKVPVGRLPWNRKRFGVLPGGRSSETSYQVIKYLDNDAEKLTFLELYPKTGRTHQIRIHMKYLNHPVVGDTFYAGRKRARKDRIWCPRLFLHAQKISFKHPSGDKVTFESPLPEDLKKVLSSLSS